MEVVALSCSHSSTVALLTDNSPTPPVPGIFSGRDSMFVPKRYDVPLSGWHRWNDGANEAR